ncbi:ribonuclease HII [Peijinzhouia sedimentorum]
MLLPYLNKEKIEAGCDEAGRGCLAGPVVAAAVIWNPEIELIGLNDSKQLSKKKREELAPKIKSTALAWAIGLVEPQEIDQINILNASFLAMHRALKQLQRVPNFILVDGNRFNRYEEIEHCCIIKGDGKYLSIAAASILAKTHRDALMENYAKQFPHYGWEKNAGYPTRTHRQAIAEIGPSPIHRMSFKLLPDQLTLF